MIKIPKIAYIIIFIISTSLGQAQTQTLSIDSCRALAIANNKQLLISAEKQNMAKYQQKAAFANYLPSISATGSYMRNQKELSLLSDDQQTALTNIGTVASSTMSQQVQGLVQQLSLQSPELAQTIGQLAQMLGQPIADGLNTVGEKVNDALRTDTKNIFFAGITLTQPIYMGGKIRAYNDITKYAEQLAEQQHNTELQEVIFSVDQAYWQVISLINKKKLAESYLNLLKKLNTDVEKMIAQGVATKVDGLTVKIKVNEAEMTMTKVDNGLILSKMLLCQLCGLPLNSEILLEDENIEEIKIYRTQEAVVDAEAALNNRSEIKSLELAMKMYEKKVAITRSDYLPKVALMGNYLATNPSMFNGFENKFRATWNVGLLVQIPIWHWNEGRNKIKIAKSEELITKHQYNEAREKIELQVNQAAFKVNEAMKKLSMARNNIAKADENLHYAEISYREGVIPTSTLLEAQTAWLSAQSEKIDAQIDVKLTEVYLNKTLGNIY